MLAVFSAVDWTLNAVLGVGQSGEFLLETMFFAFCKSCRLSDGMSANRPTASITWLRHKKLGCLVWQA
jgi:hypothetical protein